MNESKYKQKIELIFDRIDRHHAMARHHIEANNFSEADKEVGKAEGLIEAIRILRGAE